MIFCSCFLRLVPFQCGLVVALLLAALAGGCGGLRFPDLGGGDNLPQVPTISPLDEAKNAYVAGDFAKAESLTMRLASAGHLSREDTVEVNRVLAAAALQNKHPSVALNALKQWRIAAPGVDGGKEWQDAWCKAMRALSSHDARTRANALYQESARLPLLRSVAGVFLAVRQWQDGDLGQSMAALENLYASARSLRDRAALEGRLALELHLASPAASTLAASAVTEENRGGFPYNMILIDKLRRQSLKPATREAALAAQKDLAGKISLADPALLVKPPSESFIAISRGAGVDSRPSVSGQSVVLILPSSGQYAAISGKIAAGARVACDEFTASGRAVSLVVIDTDQPDWPAKVDALPPNTAVLGGPLRRNDYIRAKNHGITSRRALFAFLPALDPGDEGRVAWRFFSSAQDQVDALLGLTTRLGIKGYASFYPQDSFGQRMSTLFEGRARAMGARSVVSEGYSPSDQTRWMVSANNLLQSNKGKTAFQAIFLPDRWKNMDVIVPNFFYYNETRQVLLGTSLWEQSLSGGSFVSMQYYGLAVFPGTWDKDHLTPAGERLQARLLSTGKEEADFWAGLGYDFARLSVHLGVGQGWTPERVSGALQSVEFAWSIAPLRWRGGMASQEMLLFTPGEKGFTLVNEQAFRLAYEEAWR